MKMMKPSLKQLKFAVKNNFSEWHCIGNLDGVPMVANINQSLIPNHVTFDVKGFNTGVIIHFEDLQEMKTQRELEKYVRSMMGYALSKNL